ncbi:hypothetical protein GH714_033044 [Hevea brasiliensis]|uniref:Uncharacterized protein n=1 Tax=Hevea brasiliensis TaxID=3981 RepID=A0A6A6N6H0_HEVBR|nr:hypothetical protein GH714_033044 [Hevea brasiliensis]
MYADAFSSVSMSSSVSPSTSQAFLLSAGGFWFTLIIILLAPPSPPSWSLSEVVASSDVSSALMVRHDQTAFGLVLCGSVWVPDELATGFDSSGFGMTAIAGEMVEIFGGGVRVDGLSKDSSMVCHKDPHFL